MANGIGDSAYGVREMTGGQAVFPDSLEELEGICAQSAIRLLSCSCGKQF